MKTQRIRPHVPVDPTDQHGGHNGSEYLIRPGGVIVDPSSPNPPPTTGPRVQLMLNHLHCANTTESGHDEVYYILGGVDGAGNKVHYRGPDATQSGDADNHTAWDMNDSGDQQNRSMNAMLCNASLAPGQTATFAVGFMESDGQDWAATVKGAVQVAGAVASALSAGVGYAIGAEIASWLSTFIPKNQDDALGSFSVDVTNRDGHVVLTNVTPGDYTQLVRPIDTNHGTFSLRFRHDDGDYTADFSIRGTA